MKTALLSVGTEILFGQITNTNTVYLSRKLNNMGLDVLYHHTVGDNPGRVKAMIRQIFKECDLIITTGGLGPTQDDLTKEIACEALEDELVLHEGSLEMIKEIFRNTGREMTENNIKQAYLPKRAVIFTNNHGTAPGFALEGKKDSDLEGKIIICLPGPPREMKEMFRESAEAYLMKKAEKAMYYRFIRTYGIGESALETAIIDLISGQSDPTIATYAKEGECYLRVASKRGSAEEARKAVDVITEEVNKRIGEYVYSTNGEDLFEVVGNELIKRNISISCAESCTGGLFAATLTEIPGISKVFDRGLVTYSNHAKTEELGVEKEILDKYGAVSAETALAMAEGLKMETGSDICISVTGIAGPDGGSEEKPVGLSYISCIYKNEKITKKVQRRNMGRHWNRNGVMLAMMDTVRKMIEN